MDPFYKLMVEQLKEANKILQYEVRETEQKCDALWDLVLHDKCVKEKDQVFAAGQGKTWLPDCPKLKCGLVKIVLNSY